MAKKGKKVRTSFRKNRTARTRETDLTRQYQRHGFEDDESRRSERVSGKGDLTRHRTVHQPDTEASDQPAAEPISDDQRFGRVLSVHGLVSQVETDDGTVYQCATRRLLKTIETQQRHVVAAGDRVRFRPVGEGTGIMEGFIEQIEPRHGILSRTSRGRQHVIVANVDQLIIVTSAAEPRIKPNLIDRMLVSAEKAGIEPVICVNKVDLVDPASLQPLVGVYGQLGYRTLLLSATTGLGIDRLRGTLKDRQSVVAGQSGVGKSSLLNGVQPELGIKVQPVSGDSQKGKHTTTHAKMWKLDVGGYVVDTPGIRQFELWDVISEEVAGLFRDVRVFINRCRFPNCTHTHEQDCAVKDAVADELLDARRYESYCHLYQGD